MAEAGINVGPSLKVDRWSSERPLLALVWLTAIGVWIALAVSLIGIAYAAFLGIFFFVAHIAFITHLRGNAVRLGPDQMPELYNRVVALAERIGLPRAPDAYVVQAGGSLNALATKFLRSNFIVLYSDLLDACGDNTDARDFLVAHELGHLHAGHLRFRWLLLPGLFIPFLGTGYSRACEYTCDRYGLAASSDAERALDGLCILAAGGKHGPNVNRRALVAQRFDLNTIWMKIGHWLSTHPPIAHRLAVLQPSLAEGKLGGMRAAIGAAIVLVLAVSIPIVATFGFVQEIWPQIRAAMEGQQQAVDVPGEPGDARGQAEAGILSLVEAAEAYRAGAGEPPADAEQLYQQWSVLHPRDLAPLDPYDGKRFGYQVENGEYIIWSSGLDPDDNSDDLYYSSEAATGQ
jgi:Zn-dependent protease with chaperone function